MKKTTKAAQLRLVRAVVRQLNPNELANANGGINVAGDPMCNCSGTCPPGTKTFNG